MRGLIWPSKNKKNSTISRRSSSASGATQNAKTSSSGVKQVSPSGPSVAEEHDIISDIAPATASSAGSPTANTNVPTGRRKSSATFSLKKHSSDNLKRSSGNLYMSESRNLSLKSIGSSLYKKDTSSVESEPLDRSPEPVLEHDTDYSIESESDTLIRDSIHASNTPIVTQSISKNIEDQSKNASTKYDSRTTANSLGIINSENYDDTILKTGWINRSHGSIMVSVHPQSSLYQQKNENYTSSRNHNRESKIYNAELSDNESESQISVPDYKLYRAQLKGPTLNLFKSGLHNNVKCFDPLLAETKSDATPNLTNSSTNVANSNQPKISKMLSNIQYLSESYPHPDLKLDENGKVISGTIESLCHAVLFAYQNDYDSKSERIIINLLLILPLIDEFVKFLHMFNQFGFTFTRHSSKVSNSSTQFYHISSSTDIAMTERLGLVVKVILDIFPSFLLDDAMFQATIKLLDTISLHNDEISNNLKFYVADKHNRLSKLIAFSRTQSTHDIAETNNGGNHYNNDINNNNNNNNDYNNNNSSNRSISSIETSLSGSTYQHHHSSSNHDNRKNSRLLDDISSVERFLLMDTNKLAEEVHSINLKFDKKWAPRFDYSLLYDSKYINNDIVALNPLVFNNNHNVHFLGRLLICHLFPNNRSTSMSPKLRAKVLTKWIEFGGMFEKVGDMVSWLAVATIICSIPILRLSSSWKYVPDQTIKILFKDWIPTIAQLDRRQMSLKSTSSVFILAPPNLDDPYIRSNVISYFGDLIIHGDDLPASSKFKYLEKKINRTKNAFFKWQQRLDSLDSEHQDFPTLTMDVVPETSKIYQFWKYHLAQPAISIETLMQISLRNEPPRIDQKLYSLIGSQRSPLSSGGYLPILFNDLLPVYSLFSKKSLIAASGVLSAENNNKDIPSRSKSTFRHSKGSITTNQHIVKTAFTDLDKNDVNQITGLSDIDAPLVRELSLKQSNRQCMLKCIRDAFNIESDLFRVSDNLIFKSLTDIEAKSPRTSMVIETPKRFSQHSSNNGTPSGQDSANRLSKTLENMDFFSNIGQVSTTLNGSLINVVLKSGSIEKICDLLVLSASVFSKFIDSKDLEKYYYHKRQREQPYSKVAKDPASEDTLGLLDYAFVKLTMDMDTFSETFFNTYKSFATTTSVLENLARRYVGAKSCAFCICQLLSSSDSKVKNFDPSINEQKFPVWDAKISKYESVNPSYWVKIQVGAAEALLGLVKSHYTDFTDDLASNSTLLDILKIIEQDIHVEWPSRITQLKETLSSVDLKEVEGHISSLNDLFNDLKITYQKQLYRPSGVNKNSRKVTSLMATFKTISLADYDLLLNSDSIDDLMILGFRDLKYNSYEAIVKWVQNLDNFISEKFLFVTAQDWFATYQVLESVCHTSLTSQFSFPMRTISYNLVSSGNPQLAELTVLNIFSWLSSLLIKKEHGEVCCLEKLPESVQLLVKLHRSLAMFFEAEVINTHDSANSRIERCATILQILNFVHWKNSYADLFQSDESDEPNAISPHIPSFIETSISHAILMPKSRLFEHSWNSAYKKLCVARGSVDLPSICNILEGIDHKHIRSFIEIDGAFMSEAKNLSPCPGWVISRLLEISQFVPNMSIMNSKLINFDKRRFVNNIISNSIDLAPSSNENKEENIFGSCLFYTFTDPSKNFSRVVKSEAQLEIKSLKYQVRGLFNEILMKEVEKVKRDQRKAEALMVQERDNNRSVILQQVMQRKNRNSAMASNTQSISSATQGVLTSSSLSSSPSWTARDKRSSVISFNGRNSTISNSSHTPMGKKLGGFFKRPFSIGGFNSSGSTSSLSSILIPDVQENGSVSPYNLPSIDSFSVQDQKPALCLKTFEIKLIVEIMNHRKGSGYAFCFKIITHSGSEYVLQATSADDMAEWVKMIKLSKRYSFHSKKYKGKTHNKIFGVPLEDVCEREGTVIPNIVVKLLEEIELRGLDEVGLYRIPGSVGSVNALKNAFDDEGAVNNSFTLEDGRWFEINAIAGCFKMYLRELPDCLFSNGKVAEFSELSLKLKSSEISKDEYTKKIIDLLHSLQPCYYQTMKRIVFHLNKVHQHVESNRMDASNLAIVFSMSFIDQDDLASSMGSTLGAVQSILQQFIMAPDLYFDQ